MALVTRRILSALWVAGVIAVSISPAFAVLPWEQLSDPVLEARALEISKQIRCVVCQNQNIDDSSAPLAGDMRVLIRERLSLGDGDREVVAYLVERYGNFVLLKPPFQFNTLLLWLTPFLVFALALTALVVQIRARQTPATTAPLTPEERQRLFDLLGETVPVESTPGEIAP
jgi:cytochrome c-type biogenesis protein CcmH